MGAFFSNTGVQIYSMSHTFHVCFLLLFSNKTSKVGIDCSSHFTHEDPEAQSKKGTWPRATGRVVISI